MKMLLHTCGIVTFGWLLPVTAQDTKSPTRSEVAENAGGSVTRTESITSISFTPDARTAVMKYFDAFKNESFGLPPALVNQFRVNEIPVPWRVSSIERGLVVPEGERRYLVEAPSDLVGLLPTPVTGIRYYVAGSNVVAVDRNYRVLDAVRVPTIRLTTYVPAQPVEVVPAEKVVPVERVEREIHIEMPAKENDDDDDD